MTDTFSYRPTKDGKVFIAWRGRTVTTLAGSQAQRFLAGVESGKDEQALMQRATGNFKHGNEQ